MAGNCIDVRARFFEDDGDEDHHEDHHDEAAVVHVEQDGPAQRAASQQLASTTLKQVQRRALRRWDTMLRRVAARLKSRMGHEHWAEFTKFATETFRPAYVRMFLESKRPLACCGPIAGGGCRRRFVVDAATQRGLRRLSGLHADHTYDLNHLCDLWLRCMPAAPACWDDGVKGLRVAYLLCGVEPQGEWQPCIKLRCGRPRLPAGAVDARPAEGYCHVTDGAHYEHVLAESDICGEMSRLQ